MKLFETTLFGISRLVSTVDQNIFFKRRVHRIRNFAPFKRGSDDAVYERLAREEKTFVQKLRLKRLFCGTGTRWSVSSRKTVPFGPRSSECLDDVRGARFE